jgi:hypothetical protein
LSGVDSATQRVYGCSALFAGSELVSAAGGGSVSVKRNFREDGEVLYYRGLGLGAIIPVKAA